MQMMTAAENDEFSPVYTALPLSHEEISACESDEFEQQQVHEFPSRKHRLRASVYGFLTGTWFNFLINASAAPHILIFLKSVTKNEFAGLVLSSFLWIIINAVVAFGAFRVALCFLLLQKPEQERRGRKTANHHFDELLENQRFLSRMECYFVIGVFLGSIATSTMEAIPASLSLIGTTAITLPLILVTLRQRTSLKRSVKGTGTPQVPTIIMV